MCVFVLSLCSTRGDVPMQKAVLLNNTLPDEDVSPVKSTGREPNAHLLFLTEYEDQGGPSVSHVCPVCEVSYI